MNLPDADGASSLFGWFNEIDWRKSTVEIDTILLNGSDSTGDGVYFGIGATQRLGEYNTAFRALASIPIGEETNHNAGGLLLFGEISRTLHGSDNYFYINGFTGIENFRSASRDPLAGGPLGPVGILFAPVGLGSYDAPLNSQPDDAFGGAIGYQIFFAQTRRQLLLEFGGRYTTDNRGQKAFGASTSYQAAIGSRGIFRADGFALFDETPEFSPTKHDAFRFGGRIEFMVKF